MNHMGIVDLFVLSKITDKNPCSLCLDKKKEKKIFVPNLKKMLNKI